MLMVLFMRGEFSPHDVNQASLSLFAYASGLLNFMLIKVLAPGYYARQDTKTPVRYGIIAMVTNMFFNAIFAYFYGYVGLAMATALSALVNMTLLYRGLHLANVYKLSKCLSFLQLTIILHPCGVKTDTLINPRPLVRSSIWSLIKMCSNMDARQNCSRGISSRISLSIFSHTHVHIL